MPYWLRLEEGTGRWLKRCPDAEELLDRNAVVSCEKPDEEHDCVTIMSVVARSVVKPRPPKSVYKCRGLGCSRDVRCFSNTTGNVLKALDERLFRSKQVGGLLPTIKPTTDVDERLSPFRVRLLRHLDVNPPLTDDQFVSRYSGGKKLRYQRAAESLRTRPLEERDSFLSYFIKYESHLKQFACPRGINPRDPRYNVCLGKLIAHNEKNVFNAIRRVWKGHTVLKGMDALKQAAAIVEMTEDVASHGDGWVAFMSDASRFDQHVSLEALQFEHTIWPHTVPSQNRAELRELLRMQLVNSIRATTDTHTITATVIGGRMSGDMNTSSGNCIIMCAMMWIFCDELGVRNARLANNGDDCVLIVPRRYETLILERISSWFTEFGFTMATEKPVYEIEHIEFCQSHPVQSARGWIMVRNPSTSIIKDITAKTDVRNPVIFSRWLDGVRKGGLALTDGVPVLHQFYQCFAPSDKTLRTESHAARQIEDSGLGRLSRGLSYRELPITAESRASFAMAFGITPDEQRILERNLSQLVLMAGPIVGHDRNKTLPEPIVRESTNFLVDSVVK